MVRILEKSACCEVHFGETCESVLAHLYGCPSRTQAGEDSDVDPRRETKVPPGSGSDIGQNRQPGSEAHAWDLGGPILTTDVKNITSLNDVSFHRLERQKI